MIKKAPAKINLCLDIVGKLPNGYHLLDMIMHEIPLYDTITVEKDNKISVSCDTAGVPCDNTNIAYKAAEEFFKYTQITGGAKIHLVKEIPHGAGLGGGSSDGAAVLVMLNDIYEARLTDEQLEEIGVKIGADVPFFIKGGCSVAKGIGEKLCQIPTLKNVHLILVKPDLSINTQWAYSMVDINSFPQHKTTNDIVNAVCNNDILYIAKNMFNMLEVAVNNEEITKIKASLINGGASGALMTGSGSCVFGIFTDYDKAKKCFNSINNEGFFKRLITL